MEARLRDGEAREEREERGRGNESTCQPCSLRQKRLLTGPPTDRDEGKKVQGRREAGARWDEVEWGKGRGKGWKGEYRDEGRGSIRVK